MIGYDQPTAWDAEYRLDTKLLEPLEEVIANLDLRHDC